MAFNVISTFTWFFMLELLGLLTFPITFVIARNLKDQGYGISKILSILLITYLTWIIVNFGVMPYGIFSISLSITLLLFLSFYFLKLYKSEIIKFFINENYYRGLN